MGWFIIGCVFLVLFVISIIFFVKKKKDIHGILVLICGIFGFIPCMIFGLVWSDADYREKLALENYKIACYYADEIKSGKAIPLEVAELYIGAIENANAKIEENKKYDSWWTGKLYSRTVAELEPISTDLNISVISNEVL